MALVNSFCGCGTLESGGIILGWLGAAKAIICIIIDAVLISVLSVYRIIFAIIMGFSIIHLLSSILLIIGTVQKKSYLLLPWLLTNFIGLITSVISLVSVMTKTKDLLHENRQEFPLPLTISGFIFVALGFYFWLVVVSLYDWLKTASLTEAAQSSENHVWNSAFKHEVPLPPYTRQQF